MRQCIHEGKAGCETCAMRGKKEDYCLKCTEESGCEATTWEHQITETSNCKRCRWVMPAGRRKDDIG